MLKPPGLRHKMTSMNENSFLPFLQEFHTIFQINLFQNVSVEECNIYIKHQNIVSLLSF